MVWELLLATALAAQVAAQKFTISNGQIFTPGFAVLNAPQPDTPLGGETLHISLDVTANGQLALPPFENDDPSQIFNITVFLHSYDTGRNFTVSNGTAGSDDASLGDIMSQEDGSTVKHIDWVWPDCLVGDGEADGDDSDRGQYNISIRQNFRLNDEDYYTIFDVPIAVTNSIEDDEDRPSCEVLTNKLLSPQDIDAESANEVGILFGPDDATEVDVGKEDDDDDANDDDDKDEEDKDTSKDDSDGNGGNDDEADENDEENEGKDDEEDEPDLGGSRPEAGPEDGLGSSASHTARIWTLSLTMMALGLCL